MPVIDCSAQNNTMRAASRHTMKTHTLLYHTQCRIYSLVCLAVIIFSPTGYARVFTLFNDVTPSRSATYTATTAINAELQEHAIESRHIHIAPLFSPDTYTDDIIRNKDVLLLPLTVSHTLTAHVSRVTTSLQGTLSLHAQIEGYHYGHLLLAHTDNETLAHIAIPEEELTYAIVYDSTYDTHVLYAYDTTLSDVLPYSPPHIPPADAAALDIPIPDDDPAETDIHPLVATDTQATVDIMIVYTPAARAWAGGNAGIANVVALAFTRAQLVHDNSDTRITLRLVHAAEVAYTESGSSSTDLSRLTTVGNGYMDEVHAWRNTYGADFVALFTRVDDTGGVGWLLATRYGRPTYAFSITRVQQASWTYTLVHEIGHNMGAHHHKQQNVQPGPTFFWNWLLNRWSAGWRWVGNDNRRYCSVMTYASGSFFDDGFTHTEVPYFSNPDITHYGVPAGHAADGDNARTLRELRFVFEDYRPSRHPTLTITSTVTQVLYDTTDITLAGVSENMATPFWWRLTHTTTNFPCVTHNNAFTAHVTDLRVGLNTILIHGTNRHGVAASDTHDVLRLSWEETYPSISSNALIFPASHTILFPHNLTGPTSVVWHPPDISDALDGDDLLITDIEVMPYDQPHNSSSISSPVSNRTGHITWYVPENLVSDVNVYRIRFTVANSRMMSDTMIFEDNSFMVLPEPSLSIFLLVPGLLLGRRYLHISR